MSFESQLTSSDMLRCCLSGMIIRGEEGGVKAENELGCELFMQKSAGWEQR